MNQATRTSLSVSPLVVVLFLATLLTLSKMIMHDLLFPWSGPRTWSTPHGHSISDLLIMFSDAASMVRLTPTSRAFIQMQ